MQEKLQRAYGREIFFTKEGCVAILGEEAYEKAKRIVDENMPILRQSIDDLREKLKTGSKSLDDCLQEMTDIEKFKEITPELLLVAALADGMQKHVASGGRLDIVKRAKDALEDKELIETAIDSYLEAIYDNFMKMKMSDGLSELLGTILGT